MCGEILALGTVVCIVPTIASNNWLVPSSSSVVSVMFSRSIVTVVFKVVDRVS